MKDRKLYKQLIESGSTPSEAEALAQIASSIDKAKPAGLSAEAKASIAEEIGIKKVRQVPRFVLAGAAGLAAVILIFSVVLLPRTSEAPATTTSSEKPVDTQTEQTEQIIETKREALDQLITEQAPEQEIEQAEKDYQHQLDQSKKYKNTEERKSKYSEVYDNWRRNRQNSSDDRQWFNDR